MKNEKEKKGKKGREFIINVENLFGIRKSTDIIAESLEEAVKYCENIKDEDVRVVIFDEDEKIVFSEYKNLKRKKTKEEKKRKYDHPHPQNPFHGHDDDDLYA